MGRVTALLLNWITVALIYSFERFSLSYLPSFSSCMNFSHLEMKSRSDSLVLGSGADISQSHLEQPNSCINLNTGAQSVAPCYTYSHYTIAKWRTLVCSLPVIEGVCCSSHYSNQVFAASSTHQRLDSCIQTSAYQLSASAKRRLSAIALWTRVGSSISSKSSKIHSMSLSNFYFSPPMLLGEPAVSEAGSSKSSSTLRFTIF